ncbi:ribosomal protein L7Ae domain-containing protein [Cryptosporidium felis]|nr:ribosomal protein L7Ae domain-containing protein [Cryptosporidium felis]
MENLLESNFELLESEFFDVSRDNEAPYLRINASNGSDYNNSCNVSSIRDSQQLIKQQNRHIRNSRSDSLINDIRERVIPAAEMDNSYVDLNYIRDIDTQPNNGVPGQSTGKISSVGLENSSCIVEELRGLGNSGQSGGHGPGRMENSFLEADNSLNYGTSETYTDAPVFRQHKKGSGVVCMNNQINQRGLNSTFPQNSYLGVSGSLDISTGNKFPDDKFEFETEQQQMQGIVGKYNPMCMEDRILKMGIYSNYKNNGSSVNKGANCNIPDLNSGGTNKINNTGNNVNMDTFLPKIDHSNIGTATSIIGDNLPSELSGLERDSAECFGASQSYMQRRFTNSEFGISNMTNSTTVPSELSSLSCVATPGSVSLKSENSSDAISQRFRNSSNISLGSYDLTDVQGHGGVGFDKLPGCTVNANGYSRYMGPLSLDDAVVPVDVTISEMNSIGKLRLGKGSGSTSNHMNPNSILGNLNTVNRSVFGGGCSGGSVGCSTGVSGNSCGPEGNSSGIYGIKMSNNGLLQTSFAVPRANSLLIEDGDIYPSIGHFNSGSSHSQLLGVKNAPNGKVDGLTGGSKSRSGSVSTDYMSRNGLDASPSVNGSFISTYGDVNGLECRSSSHSILNGGDIRGSFESDVTAGSQIQNMFNRLADEGGFRMDGSMHGMDEAEFRSDGNSMWHNPSYYKYSPSQGVMEWKTQNQFSMFDDFNDHFGCDLPYNGGIITNNGQQLRHKYFSQQRLLGFLSSGNSKQKQGKHRSGASPNMGVFEGARRAAGGSFRNSNLPPFFNENMTRSDANALRHANRSNKRNNCGNLNSNMSSMSLNPSLNLQSVNGQGYIGVNQGQLQYSRRTCPPNCSIPNNVNHGMFRRKSGSSNIPFNGASVGVGNGSMRLQNELSHYNISNFSVPNVGQIHQKKNIEEGYFGKSNRKNYKNTSNSSHSINSNMTGGMAGLGNMGIQTHFPGNNHLFGVSASGSVETPNFGGTRNGITPSSIAALWAKAMSKTGGRTGYSRNKANSSGLASNVGESGNNVSNTGPGSADTSDTKNCGSEVITCARFSSFLRNNSGRLHWLRVMYHYLDTVDAKKIRETSKADNLCMVAVDDIALEAVSRSFDPSECAYWSEPENGAFVHKNIRLAVAHKVGHRTVISPQNYVNQILTASLDHSVSVLLNTLRAIDDRVRWMSTIVNSKSENGLQMDLKLNKSIMNSVILAGGDSVKNVGSKGTVDQGYKITVNGNSTSISSSTNLSNGGEDYNDPSHNVTNSTKNFPGRVFTVGVREAMRCLRHKKLKALIVAPDIEGDGVEGSLRHHVIHILLQAQELNIPTIFALNRHRIGRAMGKHMRMSVLGLLSIRGVEKQFQAISHTAQLLRKLYHFCIENGLPPTEETFKKLSSSA